MRAPPGLSGIVSCRGPPLPVSDAVRRPPFPLRFSPAGTLLVCSPACWRFALNWPHPCCWSPGPKCARPVPVTPAPRPVPDAVRQEMARSWRTGAVPCAASWQRPHRLAQRPGSGSLGACVAKWPRPVPWAGACAPVAPPRAGCGLSGPPSLAILPVAVFRPVFSAAWPVGCRTAALPTLAARVSLSALPGRFRCAAGELHPLLRGQG